MQAYIAALTPEELHRSVRPSFGETGKGPIKVYQALTQVAMHSADHRAQLLRHIHRMAGPTVEQDCLGYLFAKAPSSPSLSTEPRAQWPPIGRVAQLNFEM